MKKVLVASLAFVIISLSSAGAFAADGAYTQTVSGGNWSDGGNWSGGVVANGSGFTGDFSTINLTANNTVHLDNGGVTRTIGSLVFGDTTPSNHGWTIDNGGNAANTLTLAGGTPTITVNNLGSGTTTISTTLIGSGNITKSGAGTLSLSNAVDIAGNFTLGGGTVNAPVADFAVGGDCNLSGGTFNAGSTNNCKVVLDGAGTQNLTSAGASYFDFLHSGTGTMVLQDTFTVSRNTTNNGGVGSIFNCNNQTVNMTDFNSTSGTFIAPTSSTFTITGGADINSGTFTAGTGTITFNGGGTPDFATGDNHYNNIIFKGYMNLNPENLIVDGTLTLSDSANLRTNTFNVTVAGVTTISAGTYNAGAGAHNFNGGLTFSGGTIDGTGTINSTAYSLTNAGTISAILAGPGVTLTKTGAGTATLSGSNTYTGLTDVQAGTLTLGKAGGTIADTAPVKVSGGILNMANSDTVGAVEVASGTISGAGTLTGTSYSLTNTGTISSILAGAGITLTKTGAGTATLSGNNSYTGLTDIQAGTLTLGRAGGTIADTAPVKVSGGTLDVANSDTVGAVEMASGTISGAGTLTGTSYNLTGSGTISSILAGGGITLTKTGTGTATLSASNTYTGLTDVQAGTLAYGANNVVANTANVKVSGGTLNIGSYNDTVNNVQMTAGGISGTTGILTAAADFDMQAGSVSAILGGGVGLTKTTAGTVILSGANTYTGKTTITTGTLQISNANALGTGAGGVDNNATLDIGSTALNIAGAYTQGAGSTLKVAVNGTAAGSITATGACTVNAGDSLVLNVSNYIPNNTTYTIIDGAGGGAIVAPNITVTGNSLASFSATTVGNDLILTANRSSNGYPQIATSSNASNAGAALQAAGNAGATGDMLTVLNTLDSLTPSQASNALNTVVPQVNAGVINASTTVLNNFVRVAMNRVEKRLALAQSDFDTAATGISAGDESKLNGIWAKGYGSWMTQSKFRGIEGYDAWNAGTALGIDRLYGNTLTLGVSGGYAYGNVDANVNNAHTYINSAQTTIYAGVEPEDAPVFVDAAGTFGYNWYQGKRDVNIGGILVRTANASYDGQQYGAYIGSGYKIKVAKNSEVTPLVSLQWSHLHTASYTETEAGALSLSVASQDYDQLQSGLGMRVSSKFDHKWGSFTPEVHGKWLYDFLGSAMVVPSTFTGGGPSFNSDGAKPALNSFNAGGELRLDFKNDVSLMADCDTEIKDQFFGIYGSVTVRYAF